MIKFEYGMLVLNNSFSKEDVAQIDAFAEYVRNQETQRIVKLLEESDSVCNDWAIGIITGDVVSDRKSDEQERINKLLEAEQQRTKLGFIQYQRIQELLNG
jgi:hypothetical protein